LRGAAAAGTNADAMNDLFVLVRDVPDFPKPGIVFKDLTPLFRDADSFRALIEALAQPYLDAKVDAVLGIEARGFILGAAVALRLGVGFVPARKPGKLPARTDREAYSLEYGHDALEVHIGSFSPGDRVLLVDDVIATGGTARAAIALARRQEAVVIGATFAVELDFLDGRERLPKDVPVNTLLHA
jgi:adenine phosphoribosyltransferase